MLNVQTEHLENHTARLTVEVEPERLEQAMRQTARKIAQKGRIPGFRPGKAPYNIILNLYGREYVLSETIETLGNEIYREALDSSGIDPYAPGALEDINEEDGLKLIFVVPKRPEIDLGDYRDIRVEHEVAEVTDKMVDDAMENLRQGQAVLEPADRPAQMGDQVTFSHIEVVMLAQDGADDEGEDRDEGEDSGEAEASAEPAAESGDVAEESDHDHGGEGDEDDEHGERVLIHQHGYDRVLREDDDDLFPGFSAQIVGMSAGDETTFTLEVPEDYDTEAVAGRTLRCDAHLEKVQARTVPEWSDDLAKRISQDEIETILELRIKVREELQQEAERLADQRVLEEALQRLVSGATMHYPDEVVEDYLDDLLEEIDQNMRQQGLPLKEYLTIAGRTEEDLRSEYRERAIWRAERALGLGELVRREELGVTAEDVEAEIDRISQMWGGEDASRFRQYLTTDQSRNNISNQLVSDRVLGRLVAIAKGENPPVGPDQPEPETEPEAEPAGAAEDTEATAEDVVETAEASAAEPEAVDEQTDIAD